MRPLNENLRKPQDTSSKNGDEPTILGRNMTMLSRKIVRVTKTEFEMEDGTVHPILFDFEGEPDVEELQKHYDYWLDLFQNKEWIEKNELHETVEHR